MSTKQDLEFAIIGGGIGGLSLGLALLHRNINVQIYEAAHHFGEIGAGVSFTPNAIHAMTICHPGIEGAFQEVRTGNSWKSKETSWFDVYDGIGKPEGENSDFLFTLTSSLGQNGVHRARFLDELIKLFPAERAHFGKRLDKYSKQDDGTYVMSFTDGTTATAHAIIGCDGIKSHVRTSMYGADHPCAQPSYTHKFAYRGLIPMEDAIAAVGEEKALNGCMYWGTDNHVLTFAVEHGKTLNLVGFHTDPNDWPDTEHLTSPAHRTDAERDLASFNEDVRKLIHLIKEDLDIWAIFDLGDNPPPAYARDRICLLGDAAHATSPHHGAGAGMCIEDAAILAELLADGKVKTYEDVEAAFSVYDAVRKPRGEFLFRSSRFMGEAYEKRNEATGKSFTKVRDEAAARSAVIHDVDVDQMCRDARALLAQYLH